jgi:hypothetical protein
MSFHKRWDANQLIGDLNSCYTQVISSYNDGFTSWACKQDLYQVKFALEEMLKNSPSFAGEQEWVEQQQVWKILNDKTSNQRSRRN